MAAMSAKRLTIQLDNNPFGVYLSGQIVSGVVLISDNRRIAGNCKGFYLEVKGRSKVDLGNNGFATRTTDTHFQLMIPLVTPDSLCQVADNRLTYVARGRRFPFSFILPPDIPSSYEGKYGSVRYTLKAVIKMASLFKSDYVSKVHVLNVNTVVDLNRNEIALFPLRQTTSTQNSRIKAEAWLDRTGYVPGEVILFNAKVENRSGKSIRKTTIQLIQSTTYTDKNYIRKEKKVLFQQREGKICDRFIRVWEQFPIEVPCVPPSGMPYCNLINVSYTIKLIVDPGFFSSNLVIRLNILIGSVPLQTQQLNEETLPQPAIARSTSFDSPVSPDRSSNILYAWSNELNVDSPPPTYEECERNGFRTSSLAGNEMKFG